VYTVDPGAPGEAEETGSGIVNVNDDEEGLTELLETELGEDRAEEILGSLGGQNEFDGILQFFLRSGMTEEEFNRVGPKLTPYGEPKRGLVNANTASATVLACLPGLDEAKADQLVGARQGQLEPPASIAWVVGVIGEDSAQEVSPYLTGATYQLTADVVALGRHGRGQRRARAVIDLSEGEPSIRYRQDLAGLGWSLGREIYEQLELARQQQQ
jgi:type II secretory pathway component PulK